MAYPRHCPLCGADYYGPAKGRAAIGVACEDRHTTLSAEPGGTPSPREPTLPGRLLTLRCRICRGEYVWDYFAALPAARATRAPPARPVVETRTVGPRDRAKGKRAMAAAKALVETRGGQNGAARAAGVSPARVAYAAVVLEHAPELAAPVLAGTLSLDEAYGEARARKRAAPPTGARTGGLRAEAPEDGAVLRTRRRTY
jgi:hypothetical protein